MEDGRKWGLKHCQCLYTCIFVVKIMIILKISNLVFTKIFNNIIINVILINPSVLSAGVILVTLYVKVRFEIFRQMHLPCLASNSKNLSGLFPLSIKYRTKCLSDLSLSVLVTSLPFKIIMFGILQKNWN